MPTDKPNDNVPQAMLDELNRKLAITMNARNATPDPETGGCACGHADETGCPGYRDTVSC